MHAFQVKSWIYIKFANTKLNFKDGYLIRKFLQNIYPLVIIQDVFGNDPLYINIVNSTHNHICTTDLNIAENGALRLFTNYGFRCFVAI